MDETESMTISEFKATCLRVIEQIRRTGKHLLITKNGEPAALVGPPPSQAATAKNYCGIAKSKIKVQGDIISPLNIEWDALKD